MTRDSSIGFACDVWRLEDRREVLRRDVELLERRLAGLKFEMAVELKKALEECCLFATCRIDLSDVDRVLEYGGVPADYISSLDSCREETINLKFDYFLRDVDVLSYPRFCSVFDVSEFIMGVFSLDLSEIGKPLFKDQRTFVYVPSLGWHDYRWRKLHDSRRVRAALVIQRWWSRLLYTKLRGKYLLDDIDKWREKFTK